MIECTSLPVHIFGLISYTIPPPYTGPELVIGTSAVHDCIAGYYLDGNEHRTCVGNALSEVGSWAGTQPACRRKPLMQ